MYKEVLMAWIGIFALALAGFCISAIRADEKKEKPEKPRVYVKVEHAKEPTSGESYHVEYQATGIKKTLIGPDARGNKLFATDSGGIAGAIILKDGDTLLKGGLYSISVQDGRKETTVYDYRFKLESSKDNKVRVEVGVKISIVETIAGKTRKKSNHLRKSAEVPLGETFKIDLGVDKNTGWNWSWIGIVETKAAMEARHKKMENEKECDPK
jgi:hypothetical protein